VRSVQRRRLQERYCATSADRAAPLPARRYTTRIVAKNVRTDNPELQRFAAKRMGATTHEIDSSHVAMLSRPISYLTSSVRPLVRLCSSRPFDAAADEVKREGQGVPHRATQPSALGQVTVTWSSW